MPVISEGSACGCLVHRCCPAVSWSVEEERVAEEAAHLWWGFVGILLWGSFV